MSNKNTNFIEKEEFIKQINKFNDANDSTTKSSDNSIKNIFLNSTPKTSSQEITPKSSIPDEKLFETFVMFQNFMKMMSYSSNNTVLPTNDSCPNQNLNHEDVIDVMPELKEKIKYTNSNDIALDSNLYEAAVEETCVYLNEGKDSVKCKEVGNKDMMAENEDEHGASGALKTNGLRKQTNNLESPVVKNFSSSAGMSAVNIKNYDDIPIKTLSNNFIEILERNLENAVYETVEEKSLNKNQPGRKVKRVQPKKNIEVVKKADAKIIIQNDNMKSKSPKEKNLHGLKEEKKQIKKISTKINLKKNYINSQIGKDKVREEGKKTSEIETPLKRNEKLELDSATDIKTNSHIKSNNTSSSNVEKSQLKANSNLDNSVNTNNNIFINGESSLKKLQKSIKNNKNSSQENHLLNPEDEEKKIYKNDYEKEVPREKASERYSNHAEVNTHREIKHITPEKDFVPENYYSMSEENRSKTLNQKVEFNSFNDNNYKIQNFSIGFKINERPSETKVKTNLQTEIYVECEEKQEERCNYTQAKQTRSDDKIKREIKEELCDEVVEELEDEEEESELAIYEYTNEEDISRKSIENVDNSNLDNSNQFDIPLIAESSLGPEYKDLLSSRVVEMNNELIKLKGENEKVSKMKSEYQKLTRKLKVELEEFNDRREKELKKLKLETEEFEEKKERELKRLKLEYEEFYERKEKDLREMEEKKEDEMKKILREKKSLERNMKLNLSIGNRKDKDEIDSLKTQISKLSDDYKFKDNTNKLLIDRLRKQLEEANVKIGQLAKANDELKSSQLVNKKRSNVSSSSNIRVNRNKSETKTQNTLKKTSSVKELSSRNNENKETKPIKQITNRIVQTYKTELPKKKMLSLAEELQNDQNSSNYDLVFPEKYHPKPNSAANKILKTDKTSDGKIIKIYEDGRREIIFPSGVRKEIQTDGYQIVYFTNKDIKQTFPDGKSVYYFSEAKTTQTNIPNGLQVFKFENGQTEKHHPDGSKQITFPDGTLRSILEDGYEETMYPDGSVQKIDKNGVTTIEHDDGTREIKYPDGREVMDYSEGKTKRKYSDRSN